MGSAILLGSCFLGGSGERRGTRDEGRELSDRSAQDINRSPLDAGLSTAAASALDSTCSAKALDSGPSPLDSSSGLRAGEFFAVKDFSFELRRGELRTPGRSEKEISKKCLGATKVPDSGRRRHQCLGLIGHNGAGKTTLLKMLNGLIKPDAGSITMRGRVGALIALGAGFNPILTGRSPRWSLAPRLRLSINGSVLGLTKSRSSAKIEFMAGCGCQNKCPLAIR
jgi:hypothetical protein